MSTLWQPITWIIFHALTKKYNPIYHDKYITFFESFKIIIPCKMCRNHYNENINNSENSIENNINSEHIFNWTIRLHNTVNKMNHKKVWSYDEASRYYDNMKVKNDLLKIFLLQYVQKNFRQGPEKTEALFRMLNAFVYLYPDEEKRAKLIGFKEKFDLNRDSMKSWLLAVLLIIKN